MSCDLYRLLNTETPLCNLALLLINNFTISKLFFPQANVNDDTPNNNIPPLIKESISEPESIKNFTVCKWPLKVASWIAVAPVIVLNSKFTPNFINNFTLSKLPNTHYEKISFFCACNTINFL